jgi:transcriptional regulator, MarR family
MNANTQASCDELLLDNQVCFRPALHLVADDQGLQTPAAALGLTYPQYLAMLVLWEQDGLTVGEISQHLLTDPGSLTPLLKRLESEGLLQRNRSREDERVVLVQLTDKGRALQQQAREVPPCILKASGRSLERLQQLQADLLELRDSLQKNL